MSNTFSGLHSYFYFSVPSCHRRLRASCFYRCMMYPNECYGTCWLRCSDDGSTGDRSGALDDELTTYVCLHFRACKDVIVKLLDKNELTRLGSKSGASEVKQHKWFSKINWGLLRNTQPPVSFVSRSILSPYTLPTRARAGLLRPPSGTWFSMFAVLSPWAVLVMFW